MARRGYLAWELARRPAHDEIRIPRAAFGTAQQPRPIGNRHPRAVLRDLRRGLIPARAIGAPVAEPNLDRLVVRSLFQQHVCPRHGIDERVEFHLLPDDPVHQENRSGRA